MHGSLCVKNGILYVGRHAKTATVSAFDLDGHALDPGFTFRDAEVGRSAVSGMAVDEDHRIWVADAPGRRLRAFTLFGREVASVGGDPAGEEDRAGQLGVPVDVVARGSDDELTLWIASGGRRRHAVQQLHLASGRTDSLRPLGDPDGRFRGVTRLALGDRRLYVCEARAGRIQVFRDGQFHFCVRIPGEGGERADPRCVAALRDDRLLVGVGGARGGLHLLDSGGRLLRVLAVAEDPRAAGGGATPEGRVFEPSDLAVAEGEGDAETRVAVIDCDGDRVQVFTLEGRCYGSLRGLPLS